MIHVTERGVRASSRGMLRVTLAALLAACSSSPEPGARAPSPAPAEPAPHEGAPDDPEEPEAVAAPAPSEAAAAGFDVTAWQALLERYATDDGGFRYAALRSSDPDRASLAEVVAAVGAADPSGWSRDAQLAFYIDAYNVIVVHAVLDHWPLESVMRVPGFFDEERHRVAGRELTLNALENEIIRDGERFGEPRIHFAVNCASVGCPPLSRTAYTAENLEAQLARQTREFVRRTTRVDGGGLRASQIFEWFAGDFEPGGGVRAFLATQLEGEAAERARDESAPLRFEPYDWDLNDRP